MTLASKLLRAALLLLRIAVGGVFVYAAWVKLREPWTLFAISIDAYHVLPEWAVLAVARVLPWLELLLGVVLIAGFWRRVSTTAAAVLLALFFGLMVRAYARGETIDCGCFGPGEAISPITLLRDGALLGAAVLLAGLAWRRSPHGTGRAQPVSDAVLANANLGDTRNSSS